MPAGLSIHFLSLSLSEERKRKIVLSLFVDKMTEKQNGFLPFENFDFFRESDLFAIKYLLNLKTVLFIEMHPIACFKQQ